MTESIETEYSAAIKFGGADAFFCGVLAALEGDPPEPTVDVLLGNDRRDFVDGFVAQSTSPDEEPHGPSILEAIQLVFK